MAKASRAQAALEEVLRNIDLELKALGEERAATVRALENLKRVKSKNGKVVVDISGLGLIEAAKAILLNDDDNTMSTDEITNALIDSGFESGSNDFKNVVSAMLNKYKNEEDAITSRGRGIWGYSAFS